MKTYNALQATPLRDRRHGAVSGQDLAPPVAMDRAPPRPEPDATPFGNGWTHTGPGGRTTTSSPFGSGWIHRGPGGRTGTSTPFGSGWIHSR